MSTEGTKTVLSERRIARDQMFQYMPLYQTLNNFVVDNRRLSFRPRISDNFETCTLRSKGSTNTENRNSRGEVGNEFPCPETSVGRR